MAKIINVIYKVDDKEVLKTKTDIQNTEKETRKLGNSMQNAGNQGAKSFLNFSNVLGAISLAAITAQIIGLGKKIFELGVAQEQTNIAFTTFLGSAQKAKQVIADLTKFSIVTPFTPDQVNRAAKTLLAFGVQSEELIPTLKMLGDVSSGTGKDLSEMAVIFGQIRSTGRLMGQDLLQLINAGFNPLQIISEQTGKSVAKLKKEMEEGKISFEQVAGAFKTATSEGGLFFNLMEKQSQSIGGVVSTITGNIEEGFKNIFSSQSGALKDFVDQLQTLSEAFLQFTKSDQQLVDEKEAELINDVTKAYELQVKAFDNSATARERVIELIDERKKRLAEEEKSLINFVNTTDDSFVREKRIASDKAIMLAEQQRLYDTKVIPALDEYILKSGVSAKETKKDTEEHKKSQKEIDNRRKALELLNKQLGFTSAVQKISEKEKELAKQEQIEKDAQERSRQNQEFHDEQRKQNEKETQEEIYRIMEEAADKKRRLEEEIFALSIELAANTLSFILETREIDTQSIRDKYDEELKLAGDNERAKQEIEKERDQKLMEAEKKNKEIQKQNAKRQIGIDTAVAIIKTFSQFGYPAGIVPAALMAALGIVQIARVNKFAKGKVNIGGEGTTTSDSIPAMISRGESVINAEATAKSSNLLQAINDRKIDDRILSKLANDGGRQVNVFDDSGIIDAIDRSKNDVIRQGYTGYEIQQVGKNFKKVIRSKVQGY